MLPQRLGFMLNSRWSIVDECGGCMGKAQLCDGSNKGILTQTRDMGELNGTLLSVECRVTDTKGAHHPQTALAPIAKKKYNAMPGFDSI